MNIQDLLVEHIEVFDLQDRLDMVIDYFERTTFSHAAVVNEGQLVGLLPENDLGCLEPSKKIQDVKYQLESFHVTNETLWLDVLEVFARNEANLVPVLGSTHNFKGFYDLNQVVSLFIGTPFFTEPGGILVISKGINDYSLSEISQIVESNNSKMLGAFVTDNENDLIQVTIKVSGSNINEIIQTFRRYGYSIDFGNNEDELMEDLKKRSAYLDKYLNI